MFSGGGGFSTGGVRRGKGTGFREVITGRSDRIRKGERYAGEGFSTRTFYNWGDDGLVRVKNIDSLLKIRRRPRNLRRERKKVLGKSIDERSAEVKTREEFGRW